jgi:hypothetical protein
MKIGSLSCGYGVVFQQAELALRLLLELPEGKK